jgi:hypothetical protein
MKKSNIKVNVENFIKLEKEIRNDIKEYLLKVLEGTNELYTMAVDITIETDSEYPTFIDASTLNEMWLDENNNIVFYIDDLELYFDQLSTYELMCILKELED